jgi:hypothetical protein
MDKKSLEKFLTTMVTQKFPFVKKVEVFERFENIFYQDSEFNVVERNIWVFMTKYEDIYHEEEIKDYIEELAKYSSTKISVVKFTMTS